MSESVKVSIEFCNKCKWGLRSFWYLQELFQTFEDKIAELSVKPNNNNPGTFKVVGYITHTNGTESSIQEVTIWDRRVDGGFPDAKTLKKRIKMLLFHENNDVNIGKHNERGPSTLPNERGPSTLPNQRESSTLQNHTVATEKQDGVLISDTNVVTSFHPSNLTSDAQQPKTKECAECSECQVAPK
ncbi:hypothetical protein ACO0RG_003325 [Hanseniaspora osmophila]